ncbi:bifunctional 3-phenylpropionate/cinnamic acid dioxygenase ferredoxin subunit [Nocardioides sp. GXZ039]|uniref:bifunctional 3-phenylpropionate/cinnamic acid dioxygenase ferredoxin subunit n=1 Tax=Nocardioides sp. GXZ039 TaxID=3136018 RepID=UPI0030F3E502
MDTAAGDAGVAERVRVGLLADLRLDEVAVVEARGRRIAVFHTEEGVFGVDDRCTHQDAALSDGFLEGCLIECPLHASFFDLRTGEPSGPPATRAVATYPVVDEDGELFVELPVPADGGVS